MTYLIDIAQFSGKYPYLVSQVRGDHHGGGQMFLRSTHIRLVGSSFYTLLQWLLWLPPSNVISLSPSEQTARLAVVGKVQDLVLPNKLRPSVTNSQTPNQSTATRSGSSPHTGLF